MFQAGFLTWKNARGWQEKIANKSPEKTEY